MSKDLEIIKFCEQCDVECVACAYGSIHMNRELPWPGYTHEETEKVNWSEHNGKGKHHVLWDGAQNILVACGSAECNNLAKHIPAQRAAEREHFYGPSEGDDASAHSQIIEAVDDRPKANTRQVGGTHYGLGAMQHWDVVDMFGLDYFQGQVTKYVMRWRQKNGLQDLEKAQHFLEKYIALEKKKLEPRSE